MSELRRDYPRTCGWCLSWLAISLASGIGTALAAVIH
jgi:hypothetical protein